MIIIKYYFIFKLFIITCLSSNVFAQTQNIPNTNDEINYASLKYFPITKSNDVSFKPLRVVIFASYSVDKIVHDYVLSYLTYLREISWKILFIADNEISDMEKSKLNNLVDFLLCEKHGEYDFGSYKRGFLYAQKFGWLEHANELILSNDSCFCVASLNPIFKTMDDKKLDFWGMTESFQIQNHLQSFFLVFNKNVFLSTIFKDYLLNVTKEKSKKRIILKYEVPLKQLLERNNFKGSGFITAWNKNSPTIFPLTLLKKGCTLVKKKVFTEPKFSKQSIRDTLDFLKISNNNAIQDILNYLKSNSTNNKKEL